MHSRTLGMMVLLIAVGGVVPVQAEESRAGFGATLGLGANIELELQDNATWGSEVDPSFGMRLGLIYRFGDWFGLGFDYTFGLFDVPDPVDAYFMALEVVPRVYFPAGPVDVFLDFSLGWNMLWLSLVSADTQLQGFGLGFGLGAEYRITEYLSAGVSARYHLPVYLSGCIEGAGGGGRTCDTLVNVGLEDYIHEIMVGANLTFYFTRLGASSEPEEKASAPAAAPAASGDRTQPAPAEPVRDAPPPAGLSPEAPAADRVVILPFGLDPRPGQDMLVSIGKSNLDQVIEAFDMPKEMQPEGLGMRFQYTQVNERFSAFKRADFLFGEDKLLERVELHPVRGATRAQVEAEFGADHSTQKTPQGVEVWVYKSLGTVFFFDPSFDGLASIRLKKF